MIDHVLTLLIVVPIAGLIPLFIFFRDSRAIKQVAVVTTFIELALSIYMLAQFHVGEAGSATSWASTASPSCSSP